MTELRWCPLGRLDELQAFIDTHWRRGHVLARDADLLRWQHPRGDDELSVLVAFDGEEIRGILGVIPVGFCARGTRRPGAWLTTWGVLPEERSKQTGLALLRRVIDETPGLVGTLGGNDTTMRILRALRFTTVDAVPRWVRPVSRPALEAVVSAAGIEGDWRAPGTPVPEGSLEVRPWDAERWDEAWRERFAPTLLGTWRDSAYLRWRYVDHPRFDYDLRMAGDGRGLLVTRRQEIAGLDAAVVRVVELLAEPDAQRALTATLLAEAGDDVAFVDFYCTSPRFARGLEDAGFVREEPGGAVLPSLFQPLDARRAALTAAYAVAGDEDLLTGDDVYFTRSDCDQDRPN